MQPSSRSIRHTVLQWAVLSACLLAAPPLTASQPSTATGQIQAIRFTSDHKLICRNTQDLLTGGERYPEVAWQREPRTNAPITHTGGAARLRAVITLSVTGAEAGVPFVLCGTSAEPALCFRQAGFLTGEVEQNIEIEGLAPLGWCVRKIRKKVDWTLTLYPGTEQSLTLSLGETGPHLIYVTLGRPRNTDEPRSVVTDARMSLAIEHVALAMKAAGPSPSAPKVVHELMKINCDHYEPTRHYSKDVAWKVPESWEMKPQGASCVSIVEFVGLICKMIGLDGTFTTTAFYAKPPNAKEALQGGLGDPAITKKVSGETWQLFLVDESNTNFGQAGGVGGVNYYEATLQYEIDDRTYYYPGGTDRVWDNPQNVLKVFRTLAWTTWDETRQDWVVREVVETYVKQGEKRPRSVKLP